MPSYTVTDPQTGKTIELIGDTPPTEQELEQIFGQLQPKQEATLGENALGVAENIAGMVTGAIAEPIAGLAGIAQSLNPFADEGAGARAVEATRSALTFKPETQAGLQQQQAIGEALRPIGEVLSRAESALGDEALRVTGSPALAAIAHTLPTAALEIIGLKGGARLAKVKQPSRGLIDKTLIEASPDVDALKNASRAIFDELDQSGVRIKKTALDRLNKSLTDFATTEGVDVRITPEASGAISAIKESIESGAAMPLKELDILRKKAKNSISSIDANKARLGIGVVDELDDFISSINPADLEKGAQVSARDVGRKYKAARQLWGRAKRSEMLQEAIEKGASRKAGVEKGIRNELNNLLNRKNSRKFLSSDDVSAIRKVTDGDFKQNFASLLGGMGIKLENSPSIFNAILSGAGAAGAASALGFAGASLPTAIGAVSIGTISRRIAQDITKNRAAFLRNIAESGKDSRRVVRAYLQAVPKNKRKVSDLSDLLLDPELDLQTLENIADETVRDAIKASQFKRDILAASAAIGASEAAKLSQAEGL